MIPATTPVPARKSDGEDVHVEGLADRNFLTVMAGHSPVEDGRKRPYVPAIPFIVAKPCLPKRGHRDKPGDDKWLKERLNAGLRAAEDQRVDVVRALVGVDRFEVR